MRIAYVALAAGLALVVIPEAVCASEADRFYSDVQARKYTSAVVHGNRYLASHPGDAAFAIDLAYAYLSLKNATLTRALLTWHHDYFRIHPKAASIWLALSYLDSDQKAYRFAMADADHYLRYFPDDTQAWRQRTYALAALFPAATPAPDESVAFYSEVNAGKFASAVVVGQRYLDAHPDSAAFALDLAYAYIQAKDLGRAAAIVDARTPFVDSDSERAKVLTALFYAYSAADETKRALSYGRRYLALAPQDNAFAMDLAYAELHEDNVAAVLAIIIPRSNYLRAHADAAKLWLEISYHEADKHRYSQAIGDVDSYLTFQPRDKTAVEQRTAYESEAFGGPRQTTYADTYYDGRFDDTFVTVDHNVMLGPNRGPQPYLAAHLSEDTRSGATGSSQVFNDNVLVANAGVRASIGNHLSAFAEAGYGIGLRGSGTITDARYGLLYGEQWGNAPHAVTSADVSVAFYSRYEGNIISYYDVLHIFPGRTVRPFIGINGGYDAHNVFGNRYVEGLYGVELGKGQLTYRIMGVEGSYLGAIYDKPHYASFRAMAILGLSK